MKRLLSLRSLFPALVLWTASGGLHAQQQAVVLPTVIIAAEDIQITALDLEAELRKAPPDVRNGLLFRRESLGQLASNLLMRRVLAKQAEISRLDSTPMSQAVLQLARDRALSDLQLARLDELNKPSADVLDQRAKDVYKAESKRFEIAEEVKVRHILIAPTDGAKEKAKAILDELKMGKDFAELAKEKSDDPGSAVKGGDLGAFGRGRMVKPFEEVAFSLKVGELSEIVETQFGFHILMVTERKEAGIRPYDDVRDSLQNEVLQKIQNEGRLKISQQILSRAVPSAEALDAFIASQKSKD